MEGGLRTRDIFKQSRTDLPLISIITVVYNRVKYLEQAILSVLNQTYNNIEYILIDGGSTDGTLEIIKKYDDQIDYWISEPDKGMYHALNKGMNLASGEIIGLVNSDDFYFPETVDNVVIAYKKSEPAIWFGNQMRFFEYPEFCHFTYQKPDLSLMQVHPSIYHPACLVHRDIYNQIGLFDEAFKVIADYDFLLRAFEYNVKFIHIDKTLSGFRGGGISGFMNGWFESFSLLKNHPQLKTTKFKIILTIGRAFIKMAIVRIFNYNTILKKKRINI